MDIYQWGKIPKDVDDILVDGEDLVAAYKTIRDITLFSDKRIIIIDSQGLVGKKIKSYSIPYSSINMYSTENAVFWILIRKSNCGLGQDT